MAKLKHGPNFDLDKFVNKWKLELVDFFEFKVKR